MRLEKRYSENIITLLVMVFLLILPYITFKGVPIPEIFNDEFGYWATAAYFRGYNWSEVFSKISYYSYGYGFILAVLLFFTQSTIVAYRLAIALNGVWLALSFLFLYKTQRLIYSDKSPALNILPSLCATLFSSNITQMHYTWPECFLFMLFCAITYIIVSIYRKDSIVLSGVLALLTAYSYSVHQRTLGIIIAIICTMCLYLFSKRISIKSFALYIAILISIFMGLVFVKQNVIKAIWINSSTVASNNAGGQVGKVQHILSFNGLKDLVLSVNGKSYYLLIATAGVVVFAILFIIKRCFKEYFHIFLILALLGTVGIASISLIIPQNVSHIVYGRYTDNIIGPFIMIGINEIVLRGISKKNSVLITSLISVLSVGVIYTLTVNILRYQASVNNAGIAKFVSDIDINVFALSFIAIILLVILIAICRSFSSHSIRVIAVSAVLFIYFGLYGASAYSIFETSWGPVSKSSLNCSQALMKVSEEYPIEVNAIMDDNGYPALYSGNGIQFVMKDMYINTLTAEEFEKQAQSDSDTNWDVYVIYTNSIRENMYELYYFYNYDKYSILIDKRNDVLKSAFADIIANGGC